MRFEAVAPRPPDPVRVVVDARPIQEPERGPLTAWYLEHLLHAFAADPLEGESFVIVSRALRDDPALALAEAGLPIVATRRIPPTTRALRSAGLTLDSFLLRGAEVGTRADTPSVFHTAGGAVPLASRLPVVATLLDLAPWELPETYAAGRAARFGHRLRARVLRDAARVIVCSRAVGESARRRLHIPPERICVIPLAVDDDFAAAARDGDRLGADRERLGLPARYLAFAGRYDARKDLRTLLAAMALLKSRGGAVPALVIALELAFSDDHALVARAVAHRDHHRSAPARRGHRRRAGVRLPGAGRGHGIARARGAGHGRAGHLVAHRRPARGGGQCRHRRRATRPGAHGLRARGHVGWRAAGPPAAPAGRAARRVSSTDVARRRPRDPPRLCSGGAVGRIANR